MNKNKLSVLITRPEHEGRVLAEQLTTLGIKTYCQPLFDYHSNQCQKELTKILTSTQQPIIIFISVAAVRFANKIQPISTWQHDKILAVGAKTAQALHEVGIIAITPEKHDSEGLLELPHLQSINKRDIIIVRGNGGREYLAHSLFSQGAKVNYFEAYQRVWRQLDPTIVQHWHKNNINCIIITSNALLKSIVQLVSMSDKCWQNRYIWVVASERIAQKAKEYGLDQVINAYGANNSAIINTISTVIINYGTRL